MTIRYSRESDKVGRRGCIEHDFAKGLEIRTSMGTEAKVEESGEGMAVKIFTGAKPFPKAYIKPLDITEIEMLTTLKGNRVFRPQNML
jgi:hypothetical protein